MFLPLYQTLPGVSGSLGEVKGPLLGALSTALASRPVFGCRILIRNALPLPDFCISHTTDFFLWLGGRGCISHWPLPITLGVHYWASSTLLSFSRSSLWTPSRGSWRRMWAPRTHASLYSHLLNLQTYLFVVAISSPMLCHRWAGSCISHSLCGLWLWNSISLVAL